jgi:hypothetical protein
MPTVIRSFIGASKGRITYGEYSRRVDFGRMKSTAVSYMGYATKAVRQLTNAAPRHHTPVAAPCADCQFGRSCRQPGRWQLSDQSGGSGS